MKNPYILTRILIFLLLSGAGLTAFAQPSTEAAQSVYRWSRIHPEIHLSAATASQYKDLPVADYTPPNQLANWSAAEKVTTFAAGLSKKLTAQYMFTVDEKGFVRKAKILSTNNEKAASAFLAVILNTKISGPSYIRNKAVTAYLPCAIAIDNQKITVL